MTEAWLGNHKSGEGPLTLESVFESTRAKTKADANKTFGEKQYPVVRRQYEGEWSIQSDDGENIDATRLIGKWEAKATGDEINFRKDGTMAVSFGYSGGGVTGIFRVTGYTSPTQVTGDVLQNFSGPTASTVPATSRPGISGRRINPADRKNSAP